MSINKYRACSRETGDETIEQLKRRELGEHDLAPTWLDRATAGPPELTVTEITWQQARLQHRASAQIAAEPGTDHVAEDEIQDKEEVPA